MDIFLTSVWGTARSADLAVEAERAGVRAVWLAEHHGTTYGQCRDALALASSILDRTSRIHVGTAAIPFWRWTPSALAEKVRGIVSSQQYDAAGLRGEAADRVALGGTGPDVPAAVRFSRAGMSEAAPGEIVAGGVIAGEAVAGEVVAGRVAVGGRFVLGVARGSRPEALARECSAEYYEAGFAPWLKELADLLRDGPPLMVAASSRDTVELAGALGLPLLIGVENDDEMVVKKLRWWGPAGDHVRLVLPSTVDRGWMIEWQGRKLSEPGPYVDRIMGIRPSGMVRRAVMAEAAGQFSAALRAVRTEG